MKIYIVQDMEGCAGIVRWEQMNEERPDVSRRLMTSEINAAVEGAFEAGASEVYVHESHKFDFELLHPDVKCVMGSRRLLVDETYDALFVVGQHSMARTATGVCAHSFSSKSIREMRLNGRLTGEIEFWAALAGYFDVPVALVTGDRAACDEAEALLGNVETAVVKEGLGINAAVSLTPSKAVSLIKDRARTALGRLADFKPHKLDTPVTFATEFFRPEVAERAMVFPGIKREDVTTVSYTAEDLLDIFKFRAFQAMINFW